MANVIFDLPKHHEAWDKIEIGMIDNQVHEIVSTLDTSLRDIKGFDHTGINYGDRYWKLLVYYSENNKVKYVSFRYEGPMGIPKFTKQKGLL